MSPRCELHQLQDEIFQAMLGLGMDADTAFSASAEAVHAICGSAVATPLHREAYVRQETAIMPDAAAEAWGYIPSTLRLRAYIERV